MLKKPSKCQGCALHTLGTGFAPIDGRGTSKVLIVGEALGEQEAEQGRPFIGPAGKILGDCITRAGYARDDFWFTNTIWCRPPNNDIQGAYASAAIEQCWDSYLLPLIQQRRPKVIMPLGNTALERFTGLRDVLSTRGYPQPWRQYALLPSVHPSYIMRGNANYEAVLIRDLQRAVALAKGGLHHTTTHYVLDPHPSVAMAWLDRALATNKPLSYDIETAEKSKPEDELDMRSSAPIVRISFAVDPFKAMSIPATRAYRPVIEKALASPNPKVVWNAAFDNPRLQGKGFTINGLIYDGMLAWHVLHSDLPKSLGFVGSMLLTDQTRWKHLNRESPAYYNAVDSDVALRITHRTWTLLREVGMWDLYKAQVVDMEPIYLHMHKKGMPVDAKIRLQHATFLQQEFAKTHTQFTPILPANLIPTKIYKLYDKGKALHPAGHDTPIKVERKHCPACGKTGRINKTHKCGVPLETRVVEATAWAVPQPFVVSWQSILRYQDHHNHKGSSRGGKRTTDETAIRGLMLKYPTDPFYPLVLQIREIQKLAGTYIGKPTELSAAHPVRSVEGGLPVRRDGRCHPTITNNPDTLRTSMVNPNLQQIPHGGGLQALVKEMFVAPKGHAFYELDYTGIEALLVGYFARSPRLIRLARMGVHDYVNAYALCHLDQKIPEKDLPDLGWGDDTLRAALKDFKKRFPKERFVRKRLVHGHHYLMGPFKAQEVLLKELGRVVPIKDIKAFFKFYDELFPEIGTWQRGLCMRVDGTDETADPGLGITAGAGWVRNPSGMIHRYFQVLRWSRIADGTWTWNHGPAAKALIAFNPQHAAAAIGKRALLAIAQEDPEVYDTLRLFIHDSIVGECPIAKVDHIIERVHAIMCRPIPWLPLPAEWNMGEALTVDVEAQVGPSWASMEEV